MAELDSNWRCLLRNQSGQITIEAVLIVTLLLGTTMATTRIIQDQGFLASLVERPWQHLAGMMENGVWGPPEQGRALHPNHIQRHGSPQGDAP